MDLFAFLSNARTPTQRLEDAVVNNDIVELDKVLHDGVDPNVHVHKQGGNTAVHIAAVYGHYLCIERLLAAGASGDTPNDIGVTPLFNAARSKHLNAMKVLLKMTKSAFDFDCVWADLRWINLILNSNVDEQFLSTLLIATPDISQVRQNLRNNLIFLCSSSRHFNSLKLLLMTGNLRSDDYVNSQVSILRQRLSDLGESEDLQMFLDWCTEFIKPKMPQSLQQLCSLAVRRSFHGNCNVYYGVDQLGLPTVLKNSIFMPAF